MTELEILTEVLMVSLARLCWIGLYKDSDKWKSFFQVDLAPAIGYCAKRVVGEGTYTYMSLVVWC